MRWPPFVSATVMRLALTLSARMKLLSLRSTMPPAVALPPTGTVIDPPVPNPVSTSPGAAEATPLTKNTNATQAVRSETVRGVRELMVGIAASTLLENVGHADVTTSPTAARIHSDLGWRSLGASQPWPIRLQWRGLRP